MAEKILIVDDDVQTLRLVGLMLERQGYKIIAANNGIQALRSARTEQPDVILLDIMMPDLDGFEVTRRLRKMPETADIPILMFTAKGQVEDKVSGYEAGADDYLTKPIHPAELTAHLRSLLSRRLSRGPAVDKGYVIGVIAAKGGLGTSTLALNLALTYQQRMRTDVIAAELRPGQGTWGIELSHTLTDGLCNLLLMRPTDISHAAIESELVRTPYGVRLLLASPRAMDCGLMKATEQLEAVVDGLPALAKVVFLDIGTIYMPGIDTVLNHCNEILVVTEPFPTTVHRTRQLIDDLGARGFGKSKLMTIVSVNRIRADVQQSLMQMQEILGQPIAQVIPPAPELAYQAATRTIPLVQVQVGNVVNQQYGNLADIISQRVPE